MQLQLLLLLRKSAAQLMLAVGGCGAARSWRVAEKINKKKNRQKKCIKKRTKQPK